MPDKSPSLPLKRVTVRVLPESILADLETANLLSVDWCIPLSMSNVHSYYQLYH
jgi:hypothetical protein